MVTSPLVHDLIHLDKSAVDRLSREAEQQGHGWVKDSLRRAPMAVVRRQAAHEPTSIAIGVRGCIRTHRWAAELPTAAMGSSAPVAPESLRATPAPSTERVLPAFAAFTQARSIPTSLAWGPGGSVGFELASGCKTVTPFSDLDVIARIPSGSSLSDLEPCLVHFYERLATIAEQTGTRIDCLLETGDGGLSLEEIIDHSAALNSTSVVLRTAVGPQLVSAPWSLQ